MTQKSLGDLLAMLLQPVFAFERRLVDVGPGY
jgi:hypothetical protein